MQNKGYTAKLHVPCTENMRAAITQAAHDRGIFTAEFVRLAVAEKLATANSQEKMHSLPKWDAENLPSYNGLRPLRLDKADTNTVEEIDL